MARPGFVLETDERSPALLVSDGSAIRRERFPLGTRVVYPAEPQPPLTRLDEAIQIALESPEEMAPLERLLHPEMKLTVVFDDISSPAAKMKRSDVRGQVIEAVLSRAAAVGVDDVALISARGLNRRQTDSELHHVLGERVFRSFHAGGLLTQHDAEDAETLCRIGEGLTGPVSLNRRVVESDLVVFVHIAGCQTPSGAEALGLGLGSADTIHAVAGLAGIRSNGAAAALLAEQVRSAVKLFQVDVVLNNALATGAGSFLAKREWEWKFTDRAAAAFMQHGMALAQERVRRRMVSSAPGGYRPIKVIAGESVAVSRTSQEAVDLQSVVEVPDQADVLVMGVGGQNPYSVASVTNPILAAWQGLGANFSAYRGQPVVRQRGAVIIYNPLVANFAPLHHPSYVDFFAEVLPVTTDVERIQSEFEAKFAHDEWYTHLYRTSYAAHGVQPLHLWYQMEAARAHCADLVFVGARRDNAERMGLRVASTLSDALEIVSTTVGRTPKITYLHTPPELIADVA